ncbi:MAG: hypothetical protein FJ087_08545 [Deltaproteobacteria bacterium]|nr:hypothetical protein [Deltaproteobacteria bacterium]
MVVLYEDRIGPAAKQFGPHDLLCSCIADGVGISVWELIRDIAYVPLKGNGNLRNACVDVERFRTKGETVVAVFDDDEIRRLLALPADSCKPAVKAAVGSHPGLVVVLVERNIETLVDLAADATGCARPDKKDRTARDSILNRVAFGDERIRTSLLGKSESLRYLVRRVTELVKAPDRLSAVSADMGGPAVDAESEVPAHSP